jgi:hypothetical protein
MLVSTSFVPCSPSCSWTPCPRGQLGGFDALNAATAKQGPRKKMSKKANAPAPGQMSLLGFVKVTKKPILKKWFGLYNTSP